MNNWIISLIFLAIFTLVGLAAWAGATRVTVICPSGGEIRHAP